MNLKEFIERNRTVSIASLKDDEQLCLEVQQQLNRQGCLDREFVTGEFSLQTERAFAQFKKSNYLNAVGLLGASAARALLKETLRLTNEDVFNVYGRRLSPGMLADLNNCLNKFKINNMRRLRHFVAQTAHESGGLQFFKELASGNAYEGRRDLGNVQIGDGSKFKGLDHKSPC